MKNVYLFGASGHGKVVKDILHANGVKVESFVEHIDGSRELVNRAYITLVGLDDNGIPTKVPELILENEEERIENENAKVRRQIRKRMSK